MATAEEKTQQPEKFVTDTDGSLAPKEIDRNGKDLPLDEIAECEVLDENDKPIRFGSLYDGSVAVVVFVRHFLCYVCKEYVEDLALVKTEKLQSSSGEPVRIIVIGCGKPKFISSFRSATKYNGELYVDPSRKLYSKLGLVDELHLSTARGTSPHVRSSVAGGFLNTFKRTITSGAQQGPVTQQGGSFIFGPTLKTCRWAHRDAAPYDHTPINDLLGNLGIPSIDFPAARLAAR